MKLLIAQDPSAQEPVPVADLERAGFPAQCEVVVLTVADVLPPPSPEKPSTTPPPVSARVQAALDGARRAAADAEAELRATFPGWRITTDAVGDAPAWGIIRKSQSWQPDVIVVGAHRQSALGRLVLGSVSQKVLQEAPSSVRIVKRGGITTYAPPRLLLGLDGSPGSAATLSAVAAREWPAGTAVHIVAVDDGTSRDAGPRERVAHAAQPLADRNLTVSTDVVAGTPADVLLAQSQSWKADCIFVGARGLNAVERLLLGSVSASLAARADCSVEVVRTRQRT